MYRSTSTFTSSSAVTPHCAYNATMNAQNQFTTSCLSAQDMTERDTHYKPRSARKCCPYNACSRIVGHNERCSYTSMKLNDLKPHSVKFPYRQKNLADTSMPQLSMNMHMHMPSHTSHSYARRCKQPSQHKLAADQKPQPSYCNTKGKVVNTTTSSPQNIVTICYCHHLQTTTHVVSPNKHATQLAPDYITCILALPLVLRASTEAAKTVFVQTKADINHYTPLPPKVRTAHLKRAAGTKWTTRGPYVLAGWGIRTSRDQVLGHRGPNNRL